MWLASAGKNREPKAASWYVATHRLAYVSDSEWCSGRSSVSGKGSTAYVAPRSSTNSTSKAPSPSTSTIVPTWPRKTPPSRRSLSSATVSSSFTLTSPLHEAGDQSRDVITAFDEPEASNGGTAVSVTHNELHDIPSSELVAIRYDRLRISSGCQERFAQEFDVSDSKAERRPKHSRLVFPARVHGIQTVVSQLVDINFGMLPIRTSHPTLAHSKTAYRGQRWLRLRTRPLMSDEPDRRI